MAYTRDPRVDAYIDVPGCSDRVPGRVELRV